MTVEAAWVSVVIAAAVLACALIGGWYTLRSTAETAKKSTEDLKVALVEHGANLKMSLKEHEAKFVPRSEVLSIATEAANRVGEAAAKDLSEFKLKVAERYVDRETYGAGIVENSRKLDNLTAKLDRILEWLFTGNLADAGTPTPNPPPRPRRTSAS